MPSLTAPRTSRLAPLLYSTSARNLHRRQRRQSQKGTCHQRRFGTTGPPSLKPQLQCRAALSKRLEDAASLALNPQLLACRARIAPHINADLPDTLCRQNTRASSFAISSLALVPSARVTNACRPLNPPHPPGRRPSSVHMQGGAWSSVAQARGRLAGLPLLWPAHTLGAGSRGVNLLPIHDSVPLFPPAGPDWRPSHMGLLNIILALLPHAHAASLCSSHRLSPRPPN